MGERNDKNYMGCWILFTAVSGLLWLLLIALKAAGAIRMNWSAVVLGGVWIPSLLLLISAALALVLALLSHIKRRIHKRRVEHRIIRQAKAAGVWNKKPIVLGGRALELKAKKAFKLKRLPGETDAQLRRRCAEPIEGGGHNEL